MKRVLHLALAASIALLPLGAAADQGSVQLVAGGALVSATNPLPVTYGTGVILPTNLTQVGGNPVVTGTGASGLGIPRVTVSNDSAVVQGTAAALGGAWPAKITDGTNTMPTMDAAARAGFHKLTDGTNTMPTMDVAARAGFHKLTDGTNTAAVKAASTAAAATDPAVVTAFSPNSPLPAGTNTIGGVTLPNDEAAVAAGAAPAKMIVGGGIYNAAPPSPTSGQSVALQLTSIGELYVNLGRSALTSITGLDAMASGAASPPTSATPYLYNGASWDRQRAATGATIGTAAVGLQPATSGGLTPFKLIAAASTNSTNVKASAGQLYNLELSNNSATLAYLKLYDSATAPTCGSGTPIKRIMLPASTTIPLEFSNGISFANGIGFCLTGAIGDADTTAVAASAYLVNIDYK